MAERIVHWRPLGSYRYTACGYALALLGFASITTEKEEATCPKCTEDELKC